MRVRRRNARGEWVLVEEEELEAMIDADDAQGAVAEEEDDEEEEEKESLPLSPLPGTLNTAELRPAAAYPPSLHVLRTCCVVAA